LKKKKGSIKEDSLNEQFQNIIIKESAKIIAELQAKLAENDFKLAEKDVILAEKDLEIAKQKKEINYLKFFNTPISIETTWTQIIDQIKALFPKDFEYFALQVPLRHSSLIIDDISTLPGSRDGTLVQCGNISVSRRSRDNSFNYKYVFLDPEKIKNFLFVKFGHAAVSSVEVMVEDLCLLRKAYAFYGNQSSTKLRCVNEVTQFQPVFLLLLKEVLHALGEGWEQHVPFAVNGIPLEATIAKNDAVQGYTTIKGYSDVAIILNAKGSNSVQACDLLTIGELKSPNRMSELAAAEKDQAFFQLVALTQMKRSAEERPVKKGTKKAPKKNSGETHTLVTFLTDINTIRVLFSFTEKNNKTRYLISRTIGEPGEYLRALLLTLTTPSFDEVQDLLSDGVEGNEVEIDEENTNPQPDQQQKQQPESFHEKSSKNTKNFNSKLPGGTPSKFADLNYIDKLQEREDLLQYIQHFNDRLLGKVSLNKQNLHEQEYHDKENNRNWLNAEKDSLDKRRINSFLHDKSYIL
jgi:hypothetical protein